MPGIASAEDPKVMPTRVDKLREEFDGTFQFDLEKHGGKWLVAAYRER